MLLLHTAAEESTKHQLESGETTKLYSVSLSSGSDVSTQTQLLSACTHSLFWHDSALRLANKRTTSLPEDSDTEYNKEVYEEISPCLSQ